MFLQYALARLAVFGLFRKRRQRFHASKQTWGEYPPPWPDTVVYDGNYPYNTRVFFECPNCPYFHEDITPYIDCHFLGNCFKQEQLPCGEGANTEVHYLDGKIERVAQADTVKELEHAASKAAQSRQERRSTPTGS